MRHALASGVQGAFELAASSYAQDPTFRALAGKLASTPGHMDRKNLRREERDQHQTEPKFIKRHVHMLRFVFGSLLPPDCVVCGVPLQHVSSKLCLGSAPFSCNKNTHNQYS